jgi:hypothetical protein
VIGLVRFLFHGLLRKPAALIEYKTGAAPSPAAIQPSEGRP